MAAFFLCVPHARADGGLVDSIGSIFDTFQRFRDAVGERTEDIIPRGPGALREIPVIDFAGLMTTSRRIEEIFPIGPDATVQIQNEFGEIRIEPWEEAAVGVTVDILVGAQTEADAIEVANEISPMIEQGDNHLGIRTLYPDTRPYGTVPTEVNYVIRVPRTANIVTANTFGDTIVTGVTGSVTVDSRFGHVDLADLGGFVQVRAQGDYPLAATGLRRGGEFELHGTRAEFGDISGPLTVNATLGDIALLGFGSQSEVIVRNSSGPVRVAMPEGGLPNINATALFGAIQTNLPIEQTRRQEMTHARNRATDSGVSLDIFTTFGEIILQGPAGGLERAPSAPGDTKEHQAFVERIVPIADNPEIVVEGIRGAITIEPVDGSTLRVQAEQLVRLRQDAPPLPALEALVVGIEEEDGLLIVRSAATRDMSEVGCSYYRVDLRVQVPREAELRITGENGPITVQDHDGPLSVMQAEGPVRITGARGAVNVSSDRGDVDIIDSAGPITVSARGGNVFTRAIQGDQTISCTNGRSIIDAPAAGVVVRNVGDDAKIIALDGIRGNYDIQVENGSVSILRPETASADYIVNAEDGVVRSVVPLTGSIEGNISKFRGIQNEGEFTVRLEAKNGDVIID